MARDDRAFLQIDVGQHHAIGGYQPAIEHVRNRFFRHLIPTVESYTPFAHCVSPFLGRDLATKGTKSTKEKSIKLLTLLYAFSLMCLMCLFVANSCLARCEL